MRRGLRRLFWPPQRVAGVLVLSALLWRVARWAAGFPFWGDESFIAVNFLTRDYHDLTQGLDHAQVVSLGFLWLTLALSDLLGPSEWVLRALPTFAGVLSLLLLWRWAPRALPRRGAFLGIAIFAARRNAMTSSFNYLTRVASFENNFWVGYVTRTVGEDAVGTRATRLVYDYLGTEFRSALQARRQAGFCKVDDLSPFQRRLLRPDEPFA